MNYLLKRLGLVLPTLLAIISLNFLIVQFIPGGPIDQIAAQITGHGAAHLQSLKSSEQDFLSSSDNTGISPENLKRLRKEFGFDLPPLTRFVTMLKNYFVFDLGDSFYQNKSVIQLICDKLPVSASLGVWSTLLIYLICIPLGIRKAVRHGSKFDIGSSLFIIITNTIPIFVFAIALLTLFSGGFFLNWFPLEGLHSINFDQLIWYEKILDYFWHLTLPITCMVMTGLASLTFLTKNSFLDEINKQYVITARAKGLSERTILYKHVARNAMLIIVSGFPAVLSVCFSLDL